MKRALDCDDVGTSQNQGRPMLNFDRDFDGHGDGALRVNRLLPREN